MYKKDIFWTQRISRPPAIKDKNKSNFLRLHRNEWVGNLNKNIINNTLKNINFEKIRAYPDQYKLYDIISKKAGFNVNQIVLTPGSDAGIRNCFELCFKNHNGELISVDPTYEMISVYAKLYGVKNKKIKYDKNLNLDLDKILKAITSRTSLIILANPNSPTGTIMSNKNISKILIKAKKNKAIVLIDEAYYGFCKSTSINLIKKFDNLIISRSLSKYAGLAGARIGYLVSNRILTKLLYNIKPTHEINAIGIELGFQMLKNHKIIENYFSEVQLCKSKLIKILEKKNIKYINTNTNFIFINFGKYTKKFVYKIKKEKILIGKKINIKKLKNFQRITLGPFKFMKPFFRVLNNI